MENVIWTIQYYLVAFPASAPSAPFEPKECKNYIKSVFKCTTLDVAAMGRYQQKCQCVVLSIVTSTPQRG